MIVASQNLNPEQMYSSKRDFNIIFTAGENAKYFIPVTIVGKSVSSTATFASVNSEKFAFDTQSVLPPQSQKASPGGDGEVNMNSSTLHWIIFVSTDWPTSSGG